MESQLTRVIRAPLAALALASMLGCGDEGPSKRPATRPDTTFVDPAPGGSGAATSTSCINRNCTVRATCNGTIHTRHGSGPVKTRTSSVNGKTTIIVDFAGSKKAMIRC